MVEYIDTMEEETVMLAMYPTELEKGAGYCTTYTHCEVHLTLIYKDSKVSFNLLCNKFLPFCRSTQV